MSINNASFEADVLSLSGFLAGAPAGWTAFGTGGNVGTYRPNAANFNSTPAAGLATEAPDNIPDGVNTAFSNGLDLSQILTDTLTGTAGSSYLLSVYVGDRFDALFPSYTVRLLAGGLELASTTNPVDPDEGKFEQVLLSYLTTGLEATIGSNLEIQLIDNGGNQINWDHVQLDFTPAAAIPEPGTLSLLAAGIGITALLRRRGPRSHRAAP